MGLPVSWTCALCCGTHDALGMRTDNAQDCLTPFPQPNSWASTSLALARLLEAYWGTGGRAFLTYPVHLVLILAYPRSLLPKVLPKAPGRARPPFFPSVSVLESDCCRHPLAGLLRVTSEHLWECCWRTAWSSHNTKASLFPLRPQFPQQNHAACGTEDRRYEFRPKVLWSIFGVGKAPATAQASI